MGNFQAEGFAEMGEVGLRAHLASNFFPYLPEYVRESTIEGIKLFNAGKISIEELRDRAYLRNVAAVYKYHGAFINTLDND